MWSSIEVPYNDNSDIRMREALSHRYQDAAIEPRHLMRKRNGLPICYDCFYIDNGRFEKNYSLFVSLQDLTYPNIHSSRITLQSLVPIMILQRRTACSGNFSPAKLSKNPHHSYPIQIMWGTFGNGAANVDT